MKYPYLLLDADNTLFDFDAGNRHAFHEVCARYDIPDTEESFQCYKRCNNAMWAAFDRGECTKDFLVVERFRRFLKEMGLDRDAARCNELHLQVLGQNTLLLPHALRSAGACPGSTGCTSSPTPWRRCSGPGWRAAPLRPISPGPLFRRRPGPASPVPHTSTTFSPALMASPGRTACWWGTPVQRHPGANNYGLPCCWYNPKEAARPEDLRIDYEIRDLRQLYDLV